MRNKILKMFLFSAFVCGNVFSCDYLIIIKNNSPQPIELSRVTANSNESRIIEIVDRLSRKPSCLKGYIVKAGESARVRVDAQPYDDIEGESLDSIDLTMNGETVSCTLKAMKGNVLVYPVLPSSNTLRWTQEYSLSNGAVYTLTKDRRGPDFTLTIRGTPNNSMVGSNSSSSSQGSQ